MKLVKVVSVFDSKAEAFMQPGFAQSRGAATRDFSTMINDGKSIFSKHPGDFTLFEIGEWDELKGVLIPAKTPISYGVGVEYLNAPSGADFSRP